VLLVSTSQDAAATATVETTTTTTTVSATAYEGGRVRRVAFAPVRFVGKIVKIRPLRRLARPFARIRGCGSCG
jgi:hypothetical protein